jgi:hypothetical protein
MTELTCKCVGCGHKETFPHPPSDVPMCSKCFSPMVAVAAASVPGFRPAKGASK